MARIIPFPTNFAQSRAAVDRLTGCAGPGKVIIMPVIRIERESRIESDPAAFAAYIAQGE